MSIETGFSPHQLPVSADARFSRCLSASLLQIIFLFLNMEKPCHVATFYSDGQNTRSLYSPAITSRLSGLACDKVMAKYTPPLCFHFLILLSPP